MGHRLRMPGQLGDWLAELAEQKPVAAAEVGAAVVALLDSAGLPGPPLVTYPLDVGEPDPREALDHSYQHLLEGLQRIRRRVADTATERRRAELQLAALRSAPDSDPALVAALERLLTVAERLELKEAGRSQVLQARVDQFRTKKESAKAIYTAAVAARQVQEAARAVGEETDPDIAAVADAAREAEAELRRALAGTDSIRQQVWAEPADTRATPETSREQPDSPETDSVEADDRDAESDVLELAADTFGADVCILFAIEPADTVTLLAVLEGTEAIADSRTEALHVADELLAAMRSDGWPADDDETGQGELEFAGSAAFLERFFPDRDEAISTRASDLAAARSLASLRESRGISLFTLASATGISERRLQDMERHGLRSAAVFEVAAYVRALGGRLELTASIDGDRHSLA